jgi:hypothetical protein
MIELTVKVDLNEQSIEEMSAQLDVLEHMLAMSREQPPAPECPHCRHWIPAGTLVCWHCHRVLGRVEA